MGSSNRRPDENVLFTPLGDGDAVLLDVRNRRFFTLNETGCFIWTRLGKGAANEEVARELVKHFDVTVDDASIEVERLASTLASEGLLSAGAGADDGRAEASGRNGTAAE